MKKVSVSCLVCTGTLGQFPDLQDEVANLYPDRIQDWISYETEELNILDQLNSVQAATTRSQSQKHKVQQEFDLESKFEKRIQGLAISKLVN